MIMSTISSYDEALDFYPVAKSAAVSGGSFTAKLRILWEALSEGNAAAYRYRQLTAHGKTADEAASQVFAEFYASR
jgi:hypothetical protein